jgi:hypothetical protein
MSGEEAEFEGMVMAKRSAKIEESQDRAKNETIQYFSTSVIPPMEAKPGTEPLPLERREAEDQRKKDVPKLVGYVFTGNQVEFEKLCKKVYPNIDATAAWKKTFEFGNKKVIKYYTEAAKEEWIAGRKKEAAELQAEALHTGTRISKVKYDDEVQQKAEANNQHKTIILFIGNLPKDLPEEQKKAIRGDIIRTAYGLKDENGDPLVDLSVFTAVEQEWGTSILQPPAPSMKGLIPNPAAKNAQSTTFQLLKKDMEELSKALKKARDAKNEKEQLKLYAELDKKTNGHAEFILNPTGADATASVAKEMYLLAALKAGNLNLTIAKTGNVPKILRKKTAVG